MVDPAVKGAGGWLQALTAVVIIALTSLWLASLSRTATRRKRLPPGPKEWPILGSLLSLGDLPHQSLANLSKQYGPLMFLHFGSIPTLVVSSPSMAEEVLKINDAFMSGRPENIIAKGVSYDYADLAWSPYGKLWRSLRKICKSELLTHARLNEYQELRRREVLALMHCILEESEQGKAVNMKELFSSLTLNNITQMILKKSYAVMKGGTMSAEAAWVQAALRDMLRLLGKFNIADCIPMLKPFDLQGLDKQMKDVHLRLDKFLETIMEEHEKRQSSVAAGTPDKSKSEDFVDVLLAVGKQDDFEVHLSRDNIKALTLDIIAAGVDTSAVSSEWLLAELLRHPDVMRRVQEELDSVVGPHRLVEEEDIPKLKYFQAVVKESFRLHAASPLGIPRMSTQDSKIAGYHIPGGTSVYINYWAIHTDPTAWERPYEFDPDRFLNSTVDLKGRDFQLLPFGSGRRMCPGMDLGLLMVQYTLARLLHAMSWTLPDGQTPEELDMSELFGATCTKVLPLKVLAKPRLAAEVIYSADPVA